ncbi:Transferase [Quillaja saponaria]|uniref:Transferase n=1 Tax=Quillaja saponaria TaxID=32244 RepID=A0AAD7PJY4_QUISA|nr:Transferase [Quillaja saponaria]
MEVKIERIKRETIKPATPTPPHLRNYKFCLLDQLIPAVYGSLILFYPYNNDSITSAKKSHLLKKSLSATLTHYYPFAGRIKDSNIVECNDQGVEYIEARASTLLSTFLQQPDCLVLPQLLPIETEHEDLIMGILLLIQVTFFACGGYAIGISASHRLIDATSKTSFIKSWTRISCGSKEVVVQPDFNIAVSHFPPIESFPVRSLVEKKHPKLVSKRYVFDASKIEELRATAASSTVPRPNRVEAVTTFIWKCSMRASKLSNSNSPKRYVLVQSMNVRKRVVPPLPQNSFGNLIVSICIECTEWSRAELKDLVAEMRKRIGEFRDHFAQRPNGRDHAIQIICEPSKKVEAIMRDASIKPSIFTSLCNFGLYDADFGWGKPIWVSIPPPKHSIVTTFVDTSGVDGIETWVSLTEEDMVFFDVTKNYWHMLLQIQVSRTCPASYPQDLLYKSPNFRY